GYCSTCGHRLGTPSNAPSIPPRTAVGAWSVLGARGADDFDAEDKSGRRVILGVGAEDALASESTALEVLALEKALPRVLDRGADPRWGAYIALSPVPKDARHLEVAAATMTLDQGLALLAEALDLASRIEQAGYDWLPLRDDVYVDANGAVLLARLRGAHRLQPRERLDARAVTEAFGGAFLPYPGVSGTTRLVRFLSAHTLIEGDRLCTIEFEREELASIRGEGGPVDEAGPIGCVCDPGMKRGYNEDAGAVS